MFCCVVECAYGAPRVEMVLSASELTVGETLTVECRTFDNALAGGKFLNWYKILPNSEGGNETSRYKIGDNTLMEDPFKSYTAAFKEDGTSVIFILTISMSHSVAPLHTSPLFLVRPPLLCQKCGLTRGVAVSSGVEINTFMFRFTLSSGLS